jgi:hypothetical protein
MSQTHPKKQPAEEAKGAPNKLKISRADLHELLYRKGFNLPSLKSAAITHDYLDGVMNGKYWCPKFGELRVRGCYMPPKKQYIFDELKEALVLVKLDIGISASHKVTIDWLLAALSTLNPAHEFF